MRRFGITVISQLFHQLFHKVNDKSLQIHVQYKSLVNMAAVGQWFFWLNLYRL